MKSCTLARNKSTLIIHAENDEDFCKIVDSIKKISRICKTWYKLGFRKQKRLKIIILGILVYYEPYEVLGKLAQDIGTKEQLEANQIIRRENNKTYQIVVEIEGIPTIQIVRNGKLLCGFKSCKIAPYIPIIKCNNCQVYDHNASHCLRKTVCAYFTRGHISVPSPLSTSNRHIDV